VPDSGCGNTMGVSKIDKEFIFISRCFFNPLMKNKASDVEMKSGNQEKID
jgi:hypothetical protein